MRRLRPIWSLFAFCLAIAFAALAWVSWTAVRLERQESESWRRAEVEERVRLALWRMDSSVAPILAQEIARPYFAYSAFYPAERAYSRMLHDIAEGEVLVASPLLSFRSPHIRLHFQIGPAGRLESPQVPTGDMRVAALAGHTTAEAIEEAEGTLRRLAGVLDRDRLLGALAATDRARHSMGLGFLPASAATEPPVRYRPGEEEPGDGDLRDDVAQAWEQSRRGASQEVQMLRNRVETQQRVEYCEPANLQLRVSQPPIVPESPMRPVWVGPELVLARKITIGGVEYLQGCWLAWESLEDVLLDAVSDLLPEARFEALREDGATDGERLLASLPVRIVPGRIPVESMEAASPLAASLVAAWASLLVAGAAVAGLLAGAMRLSERRRTFVSAVTHEMRTPLTTFQIYTEMLSRGLVRDEAKRADYLARLHSEALRLGHLVENVLATARLESGRSLRCLETFTLGELVARVEERLAERASAASMELVRELSGGVAGARVRVELCAVEQVLLNLVDNASKHAASAGDRRVHLEATVLEKTVLIAVRDHGSGVPPESRRRLFQPFSRPVDEAAGSAPGIGLGLAISRRLAREMGGDLELDPNATAGARFVLTLPLAG